MKITEIANKIESMEKELAELKSAVAEAIENNFKWKPEHGGKYFCPNPLNKDFHELSIWQNDDIDTHRYAAGLVYRTPKEAAEEGKCMYYTEIFSNMSDVTPQMWEFSNCKWFARWDYENRRIDCYYMASPKNMQTVYFTSEEKCLEAIAKIGEDTFVRYVMGVVR